jgi:hypothetical protein
VLALELSPVLKLDGSVCARGDTLEVINLVALVTWGDIGNIVDNLIVEICLGGWISFAVSGNSSSESTQLTICDG